VEQVGLRGASAPGPVGVRTAAGEPAGPGGGGVRGAARDVAREAAREAGEPLEEHGVRAEHEARGDHTHSETPLPRPRTVVRSSVRGQVLDALRAALAAGKLEPGKVYSAPAIGTYLGVSATPVREAMQQLAVDGAVEVVPNRGFRVVRRGARELAELVEVRALVEVPVMLRLTGFAPAVRWAELRPLARATVDAAASGSRVAYADADRAFHRALLAMAGNEQLLRVAEDLHRRLQWAWAGLSEPGDRPEGPPEPLSDAAEHVALVDAVVAGDLGSAQELIRAHFARG
jgi:DNA-binding GntR family transcriptional regulator